jgi:hypothetical protein
LCIDIIKTLFFVGQGEGSIRVQPSPSEEQFNDTNEEQLLAPFAFVAVNSQVQVSKIFVLLNDLVHAMLHLHQSAWSTEDIVKEYFPFFLV